MLSPHRWDFNSSSGDRMSPQYSKVGQLAASFLCASLIHCLFITGICRSEVRTVGVVTPAVPDDGGDLNADLIIGPEGSSSNLDDIGGLFMNIEEGSSGPVQKLISRMGVLGEGPESIGAADIRDAGVAWEIEEDLVIGLEGQGFLDVFESASIEVVSTSSAKTIVGQEDSSYGEITLNGMGSRLVTSDLTVGEDGVGVIQVLDRGSLFSRDTAIIGDQNDGVGTVIVSGTGSRWSIGNLDNSPTASNRLTIDDGAGGYGTLLIDDQGLVQSTGSIEVGANGTIELGGLRNGVYVSGGTLRLITTTPTISSAGTIKGDGFIEGSITLEASSNAILSNRAATANNREHLRVSGTVTNNGGTIESFGGEMTFDSLVTNAADLVARDAIMAFHSGITNTGVMTIGGDTTLYGNVTTSGGEMIVLADSESLLIGDLLFTGSSTLTLTAGPALGTLDISGNADLTGADLLLDYSAGVKAQPGDIYQVLHASDGIVGTFPMTAYADGVEWELTLFGTTDTLFASAVAFADADFNGDNMVDGADLALWQANLGTSGDIPLPGDANRDGVVDGSDFLVWQRQQGAVISRATAQVPEPATLSLLLMATLLSYGFWRKS